LRADAPDLHPKCLQKDQLEAALRAFRQEIERQKKGHEDAARRDRRPHWEIPELQLRSEQTLTLFSLER
jgi:hypothetical protein